jgi:lipopolysaccharide export system protein LptA
MTNHWYLVSSILLSLCFGFFSPSSVAEKADRDKALILNADSVSIDDVDQRYILKGDILLVKGSIVISGEDSVIQVDPEGYQAIQIKGTPEVVASIRERREGPAEEFMQGRGKEILYDNKMEVLTLIGDANFKRLLNMQTLDNLTGWKIQYDDQQQRYLVIPPTSGPALLNSPPLARAILSPRRKTPIK